MNGFTRDALQGFTISILKRIGQYYNLDIKGKKDVLIERILDYQKSVGIQEIQNDVQMSVRIKRITEASNEIR